MGVSRILLLFVITITMAMFVVSERNRIIAIGYEVAELQRNCDELSEKNRKLNYYVSRLQSPEVIVCKVQSLKLPLVPHDDQAGMIAVQVSREVGVTKAMKKVINKDFYTQKGALVNCCSLHN